MFTNKQQKQKSRLKGVNKIIVIASGKGGVGKSTIAANLAISLAEAGYKVGLLDSDVYGPSVPRIFEINQKPEVIEGLLQPHKKFGIKLMSMGFLVPEKSALIWRGPMLTKAIHQLFKMTAWGDLDYLIVDTPPGTGDIHLSIAENYVIDGAIVITTPQKLALVDAFKAVDMFVKLGIDIIGIIENMSYYINSTSGENEYIFGKSNLLNYCEDKKIKFMERIPLDQDLSDQILINPIKNKSLKVIFDKILHTLSA
jgi:ATP-binding protein involved in chromosome partitioning